MGKICRYYVNISCLDQTKCEEKNCVFHLIATKARNPPIIKGGELYG